MRWAHVIVGIAWIGASFYFIWLDNHLEAAKDPALAGELWAIHGGGFYRVEKFRLGPPQLPALLHWFKWEAYWTWITGFVLLAAIYYAGAEVYLIDPAVMPLSKGAAIGIGIGFLVVSYAIYEALCRSPLDDRMLSAVIFLLLALAAWGLTKLFSGRGAFIHYGAMLGTIMAANVAHVIIPGQRRMVAAVSEGRAPDRKDAAMGKQRSVHNTYFTLPAVFTMISGHYPMTWHWAALVALTLAGALVRVWFVMRHKGRPPSWVLASGLLLIVLTALLLKPRVQEGSAASFEEIKPVIDARCLSCHAEKPAFQGLAEAPKGVKLDSRERIEAQRAQIYQQTVLSRAMPPGNLTAMTEEERRLLARWHRDR